MRVLLVGFLLVLAQARLGFEVSFESWKASMRLESSMVGIRNCRFELIHFWRRLDGFEYDIFKFIEGELTSIAIEVFIRNNRKMGWVKLMKNININKAETTFASFSLSRLNRSKKVCIIILKRTS